MGTWTGITPENIVEPNAGDGAATAVAYPEPGEGYHWEVNRTDEAGASDPWIVALEGTLDGTNFGEDPALDSRRLKSSQTYVEIPVRGPIYGCRIKIQNDDDEPTDVVAATVKFRRDAVVF